MTIAVSPTTSTPTTVTDTATDHELVVTVSDTNRLDDLNAQMTAISQQIASTGADPLKAVGTWAVDATDVITFTVRWQTRP